MRMPLHYSTPQDEDLGIPEKDLRRYSFLNAIRALAFPSDPAAQKAAGLELEISAQANKFYEREARGTFHIPTEVLRWRPSGPNTRGLTAGSDPAGGYTVATDLLAASFIDLLRNSATMMRLGTVLTGLKGDVDIPRLSGGATAYWLAENADTTESQQTFSQVALRPKTVAAMTEISRRLLLQSAIGIDNLIKSDLAIVLGLGVDLAAINGSGVGNQPLGILNTSGIGDVAGGTNGAVPTWANIVGLETAVANNNADMGRLAYVTNTKVRGKLRATEKVAGSSIANFIWDSTPAAPLNSYAAEVTNQVPSNLTKGTSSGVCSAILFANWADLILGFWSGVDLTIDPYTGSASGKVRIVAMQDCDVALRHVESFAAMKDALTT